MRRARITFHGAFHHAMNRGHDGLKIFQRDDDKEFFLKLLDKTSNNLKTRILTYCLMANHYHLVLENSSSRMSDFFKQLNGQFGSYYRKKYKGRGYVFQDRYKSILIQDDTYLLMVIGYVINNPVRAGIVDSFLGYRWSSANYYFKKKALKIVDNNYVEELFGSRNNLYNFMNNFDIEKLSTIRTRVGKIIGGKEFTFKAIRNFDRRTSAKESLESKRINEFSFEPVEKVFHEFKSIHGIAAYDIDIHSYNGKRQRGELLVYLKDKAGLKYDEIIKIPIFSDIKLFSLGTLYKRAKKELPDRKK